MKPYTIVEKTVGQTPLEAIEHYRKVAGLSQHTPLAYAGRLDPMAAGKLLVLVGDECKRQKDYHALEKEYQFEVLFGTRSDTGDVLGLLTWTTPHVTSYEGLQKVAAGLTGNISLPYPQFSAKTVAGKPLHVWTLEGRLDEIEVPVAHTKIHTLQLKDLRTVLAKEIVDTVHDRIDKLTPVTTPSKALGRDFRRVEVLENWGVWYEYHRKETLQVATFSCVCSSGTYMRSLAEEIGRKVGMPALAYSITRNTIGRYLPLPLVGGLWTRRY